MISKSWQWNQSNFTQIFTCTQSWVSVWSGMSEPGGLVGHLTSLALGRSVNHFSTRGASALSFTPPIFSDLPTSLLALLWVNILTLGTAIFMFGRKGWDGHALLVEPSKSHRGIAKIFAQVNSLQKISVKSAIRTYKEFFSHCSYVYTNREFNM